MDDFPVQVQVGLQDLEMSDEERRELFLKLHLMSDLRSQYLQEQLSYLGILSRLLQKQYCKSPGNESLPDPQFGKKTFQLKRRA